MSSRSVIWGVAGPHRRHLSGCLKFYPEYRNYWELYQRNVRVSGMCAKNQMQYLSSCHTLVPTCHTTVRTCNLPVSTAYKLISTWNTFVSNFHTPVSTSSTVVTDCHTWTNLTHTCANLTHTCTNLSHACINLWCQLVPTCACACVTVCTSTWKVRKACDWLV